MEGFSFHAFLVIASFNNSPAMQVSPQLLKLTIKNLQ